MWTASFLRLTRCIGDLGRNLSARCIGDGNLVARSGKSQLLLCFPFLGPRGSFGQAQFGLKKPNYKTLHRQGFTVQSQTAYQD